MHGKFMIHPGYRVRTSRLESRPTFCADPVLPGDPQHIAPAH